MSWNALRLRNPSARDALISDPRWRPSAFSNVILAHVLQSRSRVLPPLLALTLALPGYVGCSEEMRFRVLGPTAGEVAPTNTAVWLLEFLSAPALGRPAIVDLAVGQPIDTVELTTPLRDGLLVELRPTAELDPSHAYAIAAPGFDPIAFQTDLGPDHLRPPMPRLEGSETTDPEASCLRSASIVLDAEAPEPGALLIATERSRGDVAVTRDAPLTVPASEGEHLRLAVVAMDLAGNRSPASLPIEAGGCAAFGGQDAASLLLFPILLLVRRRKR